MQNKPIGVFDSGLGGLTAVKYIMEIMPHESIVYFGDTARMPYGNKSANEIIKYTAQDISFLKSKDVKIIAAACGTVSSYIKKLNLPDKIIGVTSPAAQAASKVTVNKRVGVIGTAAAIRSNTYKHKIHNIDRQIKVYQQSCPLLAPLIENGFNNISSDVVYKILKMYLNEFAESKIDTLVLGCTHYSIIKDAINEFLSGKVTLIDPGQEMAKYIKNFLKANSLNSQSHNKGKHYFFTSDSGENFAAAANKFLNYDISHRIEEIDISSH